MPTIKDQVIALAKKRRVKVGIGLHKPTKPIVESLKRATEYADITVIGKKVASFANIPAIQANLEEKEVSAILGKKVDALIRAQADTYTFEDLLAKKGGYKRTQLLNLEVVEDHFGHSFLGSSSSHSDGWTIKSKIDMTDELIKFAKQFKIRPKIGFLTWVRPGSVGKNFLFDQTWEQAEYLVDYYKKKGFQAKNYSIEIETAVADGANVIVFATGASGNIFARALKFFAKDPYYIYFHAGIKENIVENNRTQQDYFNEVVLACALANRK